MTQFKHFCHYPTRAKPHNAKLSQARITSDISKSKHEFEIVIYDSATAKRFTINFNKNDTDIITDVLTKKSNGFLLDGLSRHYR